MRTASLLSALVFLALFAGCASQQGGLRIDSPYREPTSLEKGQILHTATGRLLSEAELLDYLAAFPVVYVGESHDSSDDHLVELSILKGLSERFPGKVALGVEMLQTPFQAEVDRYIAGETTEKDFQKVWLKNWNDFANYREITRYARDNRIPLLALNVGNDVKKALRDKGLDGLAPELSAKLPELDADDPYHRAFVEGMMGGHARGTKDPDVFYRIQLLWDETMAQTAADFLKSPGGQGRHLVIFAGGNHVRYGFGIPRRVFRRAPLPYVIVEPYVNHTIVQVPAEKQMEVELPVLPMRQADVYWSVDYRDLAEQQVKLGIMYKDADQKGVEVTDVMPASPAEKAGMKTGDLVVGIDGQDVKEGFDLIYQVSQHKVGDTGPLMVQRGEERLTLQVTYDVLKHGK